MFENDVNCEREGCQAKAKYGVSYPYDEVSLVCSACVDEYVSSAIKRWNEAGVSIQSETEIAGTIFR